MRLFKELTNSNKIEIETLSHSSSIVKEVNFSFKVVFNGHQDFEMGNRKVSLYPDSFFLLTPGTGYKSRIESDVPVKTFSISITNDFLKDFHNSHYASSDLLLSGAVNGEFIQPIQSIYPFRGDMRFNMIHLKNRVTEENCDEMLLNEYLQHCLINYYRLYRQEVHMTMEKLSFVRTATKKEIIKRLTLAREYISNNYNKKFKLEDIASVCFLSVNHLLRTFKQAYGISPYQYLTIIRLDRAKILLETGKHSINEIVMLVGFESVSSFIRLFKSTFDYTPLKFKKQFLAN